MRPEASHAHPEEAPKSAFDLWGMATRLVDDVKKNAESLVSTIAETDWTKELSDIKQSLQEDTQQLESSVMLVAQRDGATEPAGQPAAGAFSFAQIGQSLVTGTREWIEQVKNTVDQEIQAASKDLKKGSRSKPARPIGSALNSSTKYSRLDAEISSMQRNSSTYCDEPEDEEDFAAFVATCDLSARKPEIDAVLGENAFMAELHSRIVPLIVEQDVFWQRYFYRLHKLLEQHEKHRNLVLRTNQMDASDISWDDETPASEAGPSRSAAESAPAEAPPGQQGSGQAATLALSAAAAGAALAAAADAVAPSDDASEVSGALPGGHPPGTDADKVGAEASEAAAPEGSAADPAGVAAAAPGDAAVLSSRGKGSGHTSSDWSVVSSPSPNTPAETPSLRHGGEVRAASPDVCTQTSASVVSKPDPAPALAPADAAGDDEDDDDLDLGTDVPVDGAADEEVDEDWGEDWS